MQPLLNVGVVIVRDFTLLAFAAFVDTLRLAADEGDRSRPIDCAWTVMSEDGHAVRASNGVAVTPDGGLVDPTGFDYLAVVGGTLHRGLDVSDPLAAYLVRAAAAGVPLVGLCNGSFVLARAGVMAGRKACVSWFHRDEFAAEFPELAVVSDRLFVIDRDRITCPGGTSVVHVASHLVDLHCGAGRSAKGLRVMIEERKRDAASPQPLPPLPGLEPVADPRVRRAMLTIERQLADPDPLDGVAARAGVTPRQLGRLFAAACGRAPSAFAAELRLERARGLVEEGRQPMTRIATECGYADAAHFSRRFKRRFGRTPTQARAARA